jgi:hypothetical protein
MRSDTVLVRVLIDCVFVSIVTALKTCHIYKMIFWTIKVVARKLSEASNFIA